MINDQLLAPNSAVRTHLSRVAPPIGVQHATKQGFDATNHATTLQHNELKPALDRGSECDTRATTLQQTPKKRATNDPVSKVQFVARIAGRSRGGLEPDYSKAIAVIQKYKTRFHAIDIARHLNPEFVESFDDLEPEQQKALIKNAVLNVRVGYEFKPFRPGNDAPGKEQDCQSCRSLARSTENSTGGLAYCTRHPHHKIALPHVKRPCNNFEPMRIK